MDVISDLALSCSYLLGTEYTRTVFNSSDLRPVETRNLSLLFLSVESVENNVCQPSGEQAGELQFVCQERNILYGLLTLVLSLIPGHQVLLSLFSDEVVAALLLRSYNFLCCPHTTCPGTAWLVFILSSVIFIIWVFLEFCRNGH